MIKSAFYEKEITPPLGFKIPGYFNVRLGSDVKDRLYAKAVVIDNGKTTVAIAGIDAINIPNDFREIITKRVEEYTGISPENILLSANHTHTGIPRKDRNTTVEEREYLNIMLSLVADCIILAYKRLVETNLTFGIGEVNGISFVRNYYMKNSTPTTNPGRLNPNIEKAVADIDPDLPVLFFKSSCGKPLGALICFACHQDCVGGTEYSGDFSSVLTKEMKKLFGEDFVTLFMAGTCGNINHFDVSSAEDAPDHYVMMGKVLFGEAQKAIAQSKPVEGEEIVSKLEYIKINRTFIEPEVIEKAKHIVATVKPIEGIKIAADGTDPDQYNLAMSKKLLKFLEQPESYDVPVQVIRIGDFLLYGFPTEIFCQFGMMVKESSPTRKNMVASLCNGSFGYVPTRDMFYPTIYESKPGANILEREAGYIMVEQLNKMAKEVFK